MRRRLSFANVTSLLALFIALGGAAYAAGVVPFASRAGFADNAAKVNGLSASRSAKPVWLVSLNGAGKFPGSTIPLPAVLTRASTGRLFAAAYCHQGEVVTGGGGTAQDGVIVTSAPQRGSAGNVVGWQVKGSDILANVTAVVVCARSGP
jgi:hypothetical protein